MAFGDFGNKAHGAPMAEINMVPLIDVMLVLLVIFIITAPLLTHAVKIELPKAAAAAVSPQQARIDLSIDADGSLYWNGETVDRDTVVTRMRSAAQQQPVPELQLHADRNTRYETLAEVMSDASAAGLAKIGFVAEPPPAAP